MKSTMFAAAGACALTVLGTTAKAADLDDDRVITRETIVEEHHPVIERERVIVRRYSEPRYDIDDDYYDDGPAIEIASPYWHNRRWHHRHRGWARHRW